VTRTQRQIEVHRKADAVVEVRDAAGRPRAGLSVWAEQETHEFLFGCIAPGPDVLPEPDRSRYRDGLGEMFNGLGPGENALRADVADRVHLGALLRQLDHIGQGGRALEVHVCGRTVGMADLSEQDAARRVADLYTLCFAHPSVRGIIWHGFRDGESDAEGGGLLRRDLSPKPAYRVLQKLIGVIWHTRAAGQTDAGGRFCFRGFCGAYRVAVMSGEQAAKVAVFTLHCQAGTSVVVLSV
jgi:hypothetical protein